MGLEFLKTYKQNIDKWLIDNLPKEEVFGRELIEGMEYALMGKGKRIRPILNLLGGKLAGIESGKLSSFASGIEYIHTYSLVHDDLPGMDDDNLRRGRATAHIKYDEGRAILIGDALLTYGIELMSKSGNFHPEVRNNAILEVIKSIGPLGMIAGQYEDLICENLDLNENDFHRINFIHHKKTGKLFESSLVSGAILGGGSEKLIEDLRIYSRSLGLAFQITDDLLDIFAEEKTLGKSVGSDAKKNKLTYPKIFGVEKAKTIAYQEVGRAVEVLMPYKKASTELKELALYLLERKS